MKCSLDTKTLNEIYLDYELKRTSGGGSYERMGEGGKAFHTFFFARPQMKS